MTTNVDIHFSDGSNHDPRDDGDSPNVEVIAANIKSNVTNTNRDASASASDSDYGNAMKPKLGLPFGSANQGPEDEDKGEGCEEEDEGRRTSKRGKVSTHCGRFRKSIGSRKNVLLFGISVLLNILLSGFILGAHVRNNRIVSNAAVDVGRNRTSAHACHCHAKTAKNNKETTSGPSMNPSTSVLPSLKPSFDTSDPSSGPSVNPSTSVLPSLKPSFDTSDPSSGPSVNPSTSVLPSLKPSFDTSDPSSGPSVNPSTSVLPSLKPSFDTSDPSSGPSVNPSTSVLPSLTPSFMPSDSSDPSSGPSANPSLARNNDIKILLLTVSSEVALDNEDSPQGKAFLWASEDTIVLSLEPGTDDNDDARIIQRYVLVVFYYATGGDGWTNNEGWLGHLTECNWYGLQCNSLSNLVRLVLSSNQLSGEIPSEIGQLDGLGLEVLDLSRNQLSGPVPSQLGQFINIRELYLSSNQLSGPIPSQLGQLFSLVVLDLSSNQLSGPIPSQLGQLSILSKCLHISADEFFCAC